MTRRVHRPTRFRFRLLRSPAATIAALLALGLGGSALLSAGGCQRSLFRSSDPRTQFDNTDRMRQQHVPLTEPDVFGIPQPALRARLGRRN